jgi:hypothetical protein
MGFRDYLSRWSGGSGGKSDTERSLPNATVGVVARERIFENIGGEIVKEYDNGRVRVKFDGKYFLSVDLGRAYVADSHYRRELGLKSGEGNIRLSLSGIRMERSWADRCSNGNGRVSIPENALQRYIAKELGLKSNTVTLGGSGNNHANNDSVDLELDARGGSPTLSEQEILDGLTPDDSVGGMKLEELAEGMQLTPEETKRIRESG